MMKNIICDECKKKVGSIDKDTHVECDDRYYGVEILCKECKNKKPDDYWRYRSSDINILFDNRKPDE